MSLQHYLRSGMSLLIVVGVINATSAGSKSTKDASWYLAREKNDVALFYRWIELEDGESTREMKAEFTINAGHNEILEQFLSADNYSQWAAGIKKCEINQKDDSVWYVHTLMNYPWPLKKKDLITRHFVEQKGDRVIIEIEAAPEFKPKAEGIERMKNYHGTWQFISNPDGTTKVEYRVISYEKPVFPRVVQDPVIQRISIQSFRDLKQLAEAQ